MPKIAVLSVDIDVNKPLTQVERRHDYTGPKPPSNIVTITAVLADRIFVAVVESFVKGSEDPNHDFNVTVEKYKAFEGMYVQKTFCKDAITAIAWIFQHLHAEAPGVVAIWNANFDMQCIISTIIEAGEDPSKYLGDPSLPEKFRIFSYFPGFKTRETSDKRLILIPPAQRMPSFASNASFNYVDAMCLYAERRRHQPMEESYNLGRLVKKYTDFVNPVFDVLYLELSGIAWHRKFQEELPFDYIVGSIFTSLSLLALEKVTTDLTVTYSTNDKTVVLNDFNKGAE